MCGGGGACGGGSRIPAAQAGCEPSPKMTSPVVKRKRKTTAQQATLRSAPSGAMSRTERRPEAKASALGGVETGNIKAHDAARVVGMISSNGCTSITCDRLAIMGSDKEMVAVFEATSVNPVIKATVLMTMVKGLASPISTCNWPAI